MFFCPRCPFVSRRTGKKRRISNQLKKVRWSKNIFEAGHSGGDGGSGSQYSVRGVSTRFAADWSSSCTCSMHTILYCCSPSLLPLLRHQVHNFGILADAQLQDSATTRLHIWPPSPTWVLHHFWLSTCSAHYGKKTVELFICSGNLLGPPSSGLDKFGSGIFRVKSQWCALVLGGNT